MNDNPIREILREALTNAIESRGAGEPEYYISRDDADLLEATNAIRKYFLELPAMREEHMFGADPEFVPDVDVAYMKGRNQLRQEIREQLGGGDE